MPTPPPPTAAPLNRLRALDALRGLAALYVVCGHAAQLLHEGFKNGYAKHPEAYGLPGKCAVHFLLIFNWGYEAVILFFVLSGFAIHFRQAKEAAAFGAKAQLDLRQYFWRRARRLYPPLLLALCLTLALDQIGLAWHWAIYTDASPYGLAAAAHETKTFLMNLLFMMDVFAPPYGTDIPLWSLRYEAAFYALYPAIWWLGRKNPWRAAACLLALFCATLILEKHFPDAWAKVPPVIGLPLQGVAVWWLGGMLADALAGRLPIRLKQAAWLMLLIPFGLHGPLADCLNLPLFARTLILGMGFSGLIAACLAWRESLAKLVLVEWLGKLGDCSYTLYVIHMPLLFFMGGWLMAGSPDGHRMPASTLWFLPGVALCLALAWVAHFIVEKPFMGGPKKEEAKA